MLRVVEPAHGEQDIGACSEAVRHSQLELHTRRRHHSLTCRARGHGRLQPQQHLDSGAQELKSLVVSVAVLYCTVVMLETFKKQHRHV